MTPTDPALASGPASRVDRRALVSRHNPQLGLDDRAVLSVGNGSFAVGLDRTGTHTLPARPGAPQTTALAEWGWHSLPQTDDATWEEHFRLYDSPRGEVPYMDLVGPSEPGADEGRARWFRANPHKVSLLRLVLVDRESGEALQEADLTDAHQVLDLWNGLVTSTFRHRGRPVTVTVAADPEIDALSLRVDAAHLALELHFPYGTEDWDGSADWTRPEAHRTAVDGTVIHRDLDDLGYRVVVCGAQPRLLPPHRVRLDVEGESTGTDSAGIDIALRLHPHRSPHLGRTARRSSVQGLPAEAAVIRGRARRFWNSYWQETGALDLSASDDPRAHELEHRVILSRYLQRVHAAGTMPPAETGLLQNSWRGRAHLEMHWWHAAHFPLWGDVASLLRSMAFYADALPAARATARAQRCRGARWPKQIGPDLRESPSDIGPFLLWQQPHPIHLAELCRRADPALGSDPMLQEIVEESALFLRDVLREGPDGRLGLGPPLVGAQERHVADRSRLCDPAFELAYTSWALRIADEWRARRGDRRAGELSADVARLRSPLRADGRLRTFVDGPPMERSDHPAHLLAHGLVPPTGTISDAAAAEALEDALADWDWQSTWGWDCPAAALTATRLGRPEQAVDLLLRDTPKNRFDAAGHCFQRDTLPLYLPANGGTLVAAALMAAGWDGSGPTPGLPAHWGARVDGISPLPGPLPPLERP